MFCSCRIRFHVRGVPLDPGHFSLSSGVISSLTSAPAGPSNASGSSTFSRVHVRLQRPNRERLHRMIPATGGSFHARSGKAYKDMLSVLGHSVMCIRYHYMSYLQQEAQRVTKAHLVLVENPCHVVNLLANLLDYVSRLGQHLLLQSSPRAQLLQISHEVQGCLCTPQLAAVQTSTSVLEVLQGQGTLQEQRHGSCGTSN